MLRRATTIILLWAAVASATSLVHTDFGDKEGAPRRKRISLAEGLAEDIEAAYNTGITSGNAVTDTSALQRMASNMKSTEGNAIVKKYLDALSVYADYRKSLRSMSGIGSKVAMLRNIRKLDAITSIDDTSRQATQSKLVVKWRKYSDNETVLADYFYKMETATFPEPLTDELIQMIIDKPGFRFRNDQDLIGKVTHQLTEFIKHIHTLDQLQRDEPKILAVLEQYSQLPHFEELAGDPIEMCLKTRPMQIQAGLDKNISGMLEHMRNYYALNTEHPTGVESFHAYLRDNETRVNGLCKGDVELFLDQHRNMGFEECWKKAGLQFLEHLE